MSLSLLLKADKLKQTLTWSGRMFQVSAAQYNTIQIWLSVNSPWELFRDNSNNKDTKNTQKLSINNNIIIIIIEKRFTYKIYDIKNWFKKKAFILR